MSVKWRIVLEVSDDDRMGVPLSQKDVGQLTKNALANAPLRLCYTIKSVKEGR